MDFNMEIDNNSRKRFRDEVDFQAANGDHVAKRARQSDLDASARDHDDSTPPTPDESAVSTPASMDVEMDDPFRAAAVAPAPAPEPKPQPQAQTQPQPQPQPRSQSTIISGWNQSRRNHYLNQGYPSYWMQNSAQVCSYLVFDQVFDHADM